MTVSRFRVVNHTVAAIQWTGDNLAAIQAFAFPHSPLVDGGADPATRVLTINVLDRENMQRYPALGRQVKGVVAIVGSWIVTGDDGELKVVHAEEFARQYVLADAGAEGAAQPPPFPLGGPIVATHPRFVDRLPEEGERDAIPSETLKDA